MRDFTDRIRDTHEKVLTEKGKWLLVIDKIRSNSHQTTYKPVPKDSHLANYLDQEIPGKGEKIMYTLYAREEDYWTDRAVMRASVTQE